MNVIPEFDSVIPVLFFSVAIANRCCMLDTRTSNSLAAGICDHEILKLCSITYMYNSY